VRALAVFCFCGYHYCVPPQTFRVFVAVQFSDGLRRQLAEAIARLSRAVPPRSVQWVKAENIHITLKFLGDTPVNDIAKIGEALTSAVSAAEPFEFAPNGFGCFPDARKPRVVWIGVDHEGGQKLKALASAVEAALAPLGYPPEPRPFSPHVTLGRIRRETPPRDASRVGAVIAAQPAAQWPAEKVSAAHLMKSDLRPGGSVYTSLRLAPLRPHS